MLVVSVACCSAVAGGVGFYVLTRKAADKTAGASEEDAEIDAFLKDVKLSFQKAQHVAKRAAATAAAAPGGGRRRLQQRRELRRRQQVRPAAATSSSTTP